MRNPLPSGSIHAVLAVSNVGNGVVSRSLPEACPGMVTPVVIRGGGVSGGGGRVALFSVYVNGSDSAATGALPTWANYWAESCGTQSRVADCVLVVIYKGALATNESDNHHRTRASGSEPANAEECAWRQHWASFSNWRRSSEQSALFFAGRSSTDPLPENVILLFIPAAEMDRRLQLVSQMSHPAVCYSCDESDERGPVGRHKQADLKPLYGDLFADVLGVRSGGANGISNALAAPNPRFTYSHWGFTDVDQVFGDLAGFFRLVPLHLDLQGPHVQTSYFVEPGGFDAPYLPGQLTILANEPLVTRFWRSAPASNRIFEQRTYSSFDEVGFGHYVHESAASVGGLRVRHIWATGTDAGGCKFNNRWDWDTAWERAVDVQSDEAGSHLYRIRSCDPARPVDEVAVYHFGCTKNFFGEHLVGKTASEAALLGVWPQQGWRARRWNITAHWSPPYWSFSDPSWGMRKVKQWGLLDYAGPSCSFADRRSYAPPWSLPWPQSGPPPYLASDDTPWEWLMRSPVAWALLLAPILVCHSWLRDHRSVVRSGVTRSCGSSRALRGCRGLVPGGFYRLLSERVRGQAHAHDHDCGAAT